MDVFDLAAKLTLDASEYTKGLADAKTSSASFGTVAKGVATAAAGVATGVAALSAAAVSAGKALYDNVSATAEAGDEIDKQSQKLGLSTEAYQEWAYVLELSGTEINSMSTGLKTLTNKLDDAKNGSEEAASLFEALGLSMEDLQSMSREDVFEQTIFGFQQMADSTERAALANDLFGKSGQELTPLFNQSTEATLDQIEAAHEYGMVMSEETVAASAAFQDALTKLNGTVEGVKNSLLADFLPSITLVMDGISDLIAGNEVAADELTEGFTSAINNIKDVLPRLLSVFEQVVPVIAEIAPQIIETLVDGITESLPKLVPTAVSLIEKLIGTISKSMPKILKAGIQILTGLVNGIAQMAPTAIPMVVQAIVDMVTVIFEESDTMLDAAVSLIDGLATGIVNALPVLIDALPAIIGGIVSFIENSTSAIIEASAILLLAIADAIPTVIIELNKVMPDIIFAIIEAFQNAGPEMGVACLELLGAILVVIPEIIAQLAVAIPEVNEAILKSLEENWPKMVQNGIDSAGKFIAGLGDSTVFTKIGDKIAEIEDKIKEVFNSYFPQMKEIGTNIIQGLIDGISAMTSEVGNTVTSIGSSIASGFKSFFGIASPSKLFKEYGKFIDEGLAIGIEGSADDVFAAMNGIETGLGSFDVESGSYFAEAPKQTSSLENNVTVVIEGEMAELFKAMVKENKQYTRANGISAFA